MKDEVIDSVLIDPCLDSYLQFFDHDWCKHLYSRIANSPLKKPVDTLMVAWRSISGSHRLPWLLVETLKSFAEGEGIGNIEARMSYSEKFIGAIVEKLDSAMQYSLSLEQRATLKRAVKKIEKDAFECFKVARSQVQFEGLGYWNDLVHKQEFQFCLVGTQGSNYGSLFFAYEDFLANTIRTREPYYTSKRTRGVQGNHIKDAFARHFGEPLRDYCWSHTEIELAMLVRHALAHNGGRFGDDLEKYRGRFDEPTDKSKIELHEDRFVVDGGKIQITPRNVTYLFGILKDRVAKIVEELA